MRSTYFFMLIMAFAGITQCFGQEFWHNKERDLRYHPMGDDIVILNGDKRFNRALYGGHSDFRVETGDLPEFALFLPRMGGNIKFGIENGDQSKWLINSDSILAIYRAGSMLYEVKDELLGNAVLNIQVLAMAEIEGILIKLELSEQINAKLIWVYGGACGKGFHRNGDIGADPESVFYLHPEYCDNDRFKIDNEGFELTYFHQKIKEDRTINGLFPSESKVKICDANKQESLKELLLSKPEKQPVITGEIDLKKALGSFYFSVYKPELAGDLEYNNLAGELKKAEEKRLKYANQIEIITPDPFINTLGSVLPVAADGVWDGKAFMHGAVAWRMPLNGWRGASMADPLGWGDRARIHFRGYAQAQYLDPDSGSNVPDPNKGFARQQEKKGNSLFTKGYISRKPGKPMKPHHYDMNLVFIDQILRHLDWTGDTVFLEEMWPTIERHMEWEKRCFDGNNDGLYDAYCCIWASDGLQYSGGGVTHSSAYNYFSNLKVAHMAEILGKDPSIYQKEAMKIKKSMKENLWIEEKGLFAEYKDLLGNQLVHTSPALWTYYHTIDSKVPSEMEAYRMMQNVTQKIPQIPVRANGLSGDFHTISTSNWMPYTWSINNVALAEVMHASLAYWQADQPQIAFKLWQSALIESMYLGSSPGNIQQLSFYDAFRGELYRDFADPIGMVTRSLVEGLFGIQPDALNDNLLIKPGFPSEWNNASIKLPEISVQYSSNTNIDTYIIRQGLRKKLNLLLQVKAKSIDIKELKVNGTKVAFKVLSNSVGGPEIEIDCGKSVEYNVEIAWGESKPENNEIKLSALPSQILNVKTPNAKPLEIYDPEKIFSKIELYENGFNVTALDNYNANSFYVKLNQGDMEWWQPVNIKVDAPVKISYKKKEDTYLVTLVNNINEKIKIDLLLNNKEMILSGVGIKAKSSYDIELPLSSLYLGTNTISIKGTGIDIEEKLVDWELTSANTKNTQKVSLEKYFNDEVTNIFKNEYQSPRSPYPTLQLPINGIGNWCYNTIHPEINDSGLRKLAGEKNEIFIGNNIPFKINGATDGNNIAFASLWDNYPEEVSIPLKGNASHAYLLMTGSTSPMQSRFINGKVEVKYIDGSSEVLELKNPETWWPIEQDYYQDGYAFDIGAPLPYRVHLKTGLITREFNDYSTIKGFTGRAIEGGAATLLDLPLNPNKELKEIRIKAVANDVVIGLMSLTLIK